MAVRIPAGLQAIGQNVVGTPGYQPNYHQLITDNPVYNQTAANVAASLKAALAQRDAALQGGAFLKGLLGFSPEGKTQPYHLGHFFMAINIEAFTELENFKKSAGDILRALRASKKAPGQKRIYTAGEKEYLVWLERKDKGVPVNEPLQKDIRALVKELKLTAYKFPFL